MPSRSATVFNSLPNQPTMVQCTTIQRSKYSNIVLALFADTRKVAFINYKHVLAVFIELT
jgi:hypothetical protein